MFKLKLLPKYELESITKENGYREYNIPDIGWVPSVTTYLSKILDQSSLDKWKTKVGQKEADRIGRIAKDRGTSIHKLSEAYLSNDPNWKQVINNPIHLHDFSYAVPILNKNIDTIYGIEYSLYSKINKLAGRTDAIVSWNGQPTILDFKTSKKLKKEEYLESYYLQSSIYADMTKELYNLDIQQICIFILVDGEEPQVLVREKLKHDYSNIL